VSFRVALAESSGLADRSVDLITAAQAAHWFDLPAFHVEARRVAKAGGVLALWGYGRLVLPGEMDTVFEQFYNRTLGAYWPPERRLIDDAYRSVDFPFAELAVPAFCIDVSWNLPRLLAYVSTWSAVKRYAAATGQDPLPALEAALVRHWTDPQNVLALQWPVFMRAGRT
jgi:SAM-dependent methyltransferase